MSPQQREDAIKKSSAESQATTNPKFFTPFRIFSILGLILLVTYIVYCYYPFGVQYLPYRVLFYMIGILVSIIGGTRLIYLLAASQLKLAEYKIIEIVIYYCILTAADQVCLQIIAYRKSDTYRERLHQERLQPINDRIALEPTNDTLFLERGLLKSRYFKFKNKPAALQDFETALEIDPNNSETLMLIGHHHSKFFDYEEAIEMYERAIAVDSSKMYLKKKIALHKERLETKKETQNEQIK